MAGRASETRAARLSTKSVVPSQAQNDLLPVFGLLPVLNKKSHAASSTMKIESDDHGECSFSRNR